MVIFKSNKYRKWYCMIIDRAQSLNRKKGDGTYYESHHVVPSSISGTNRSLGRKVLLTAKEHYVCHHLLIKFVSDAFVTAMQWALFSMSRHNSKLNGLTASQYEIARIEFSKAQCGENNPFYGKKHTAEHKARMSGIISKAKKGTIPWNKCVPMSDEQKKKLSLAKKGKTPSNKGIAMSKDQRLKLSISMKAGWETRKKLYGPTGKSA